MSTLRSRRKRHMPPRSGVDISRLVEFFYVPQGTDKPPRAEIRIRPADIKRRHRNA